MTGSRACAERTSTFGSPRPGAPRRLDLRPRRGGPRAPLRRSGHPRRTRPCGRIQSARGASGDEVFRLQRGSRAPRDCSRDWRSATSRDARKRCSIWAPPRSAWAICPVRSSRTAGQRARARARDAEPLARAAIGLEEACRRGLIVGDEVVEVLEEASEAVGQRRLAAPRADPRRARARVGIPGRSRERERRRRERSCDGPSARRSPRPRAGLVQLLLGARQHAA